MSQYATIADKDVPWLLQDRAIRFPDRPVLCWEPFDGTTQTWTYRAFWECVCRTAAGLKASGVKPGDRILIHAGNSPETLIAWFASATLGSIGVTTNPAATALEVEHYLTATGARKAITDADGFPALRSQKGLEQIWLTGGDTPKDPGLPVQAFEQLAGCSGPPPDRERSPMQPLSIQFTSGSTSKPKAVLWTHANAIWGARVSAMHQRLDETDTYLTFLPLFHTNAQTYSVLPTIWAGGTIVLQPKFSASRFWPASLKHRCTRTSMVPFCFGALNKHPVPGNHSYRTWGLGVAHPSGSEKFGVSVLGWWGMTETIAQGIVSDPSANHPYLSMGYASPTYEVSVRSESGAEIRSGSGRLFIRGERGVSLFLEYFGNPTATEAAFDQDGWFDTGDIVCLGPDGDFYFESRASDIIKCGGENMSAKEIEGALNQINDVVESAVIAKPDKMYGEVPVAFVVRSSDTDETADLIEHCGRLLAPFKVPREIYILKGLPRGAVNKVAKGELRKMLQP